jgi:hypothetical protein
MTSRLSSRKRGNHQVIHPQVQTLEMENLKKSRKKMRRMKTKISLISYRGLLSIRRCKD